MADLLPGMPPALRDEPAVPRWFAGSASESADGRYRSDLRRTWEHGLPTAVWVMLNPSTASHAADDPTIRRVMQFSRAFGCGACVVVNLYNYRATRPADLWAAAEPVSWANDPVVAHHIARAEARGWPLIAAWGAQAQPERVAAVMAMPGANRMTALATTKSGQPRHPLYLPGHLRPLPWAPPRSPSAGPVSAGQ